MSLSTVIFIFQAIPTFTKKVGEVPLNLTIKLCAGECINMVNALNLQILDSAAFCTEYMVMRSNISVEAVWTNTSTKFLDFPQFCQKREIPINSSKT